MSEVFTAVLTAPNEYARESFKRAMDHASAMLSKDEKVLVSVGPSETDRSIEQNKFYWGVLLKAISEQVRTPDRWMPEAWHHLMRRKFLGYEIKKEIVAGKKKPVVIRRLRSTRDLSVKQFAEYVEKITAYAVTELHVQFEEPA